MKRWMLVLGVLALAGCSAATDDGGPAEPSSSETQGLSCATILCIEGTVCVEHGNSARCVKPKRDKDPCALVKCMAGYECVASGGTATCEPICEPADCGPALGMPIYLCEDGVSVAGPTGNCIDQGGQCGWEVLSCP